VFACVALLLVSAAACKGGGKYGEIKKVLTKYVDASEKFAGALEGAKDASAVAKAIEAYTVVAKVVAPQIKALSTKYPELKDMDQNPPEELKSLIDRTQTVGAKLMGMMGKIAEFASDPKVQEAQKKMTEAMGEMQ